MRPFFSLLCNPKSKVVAIFTVGVCLIGGGRLYRLWQPEEQVRLHQRHFLDALEAHNRNAFASFVATDFHDAYGHDKAWLLEKASEVRRHFFALEMREEGAPLITWPAGGVASRAESQAVLRLGGNGTAVAQEVIRTANRNPDPVRFFWRKPGWKPWHWELVSLDHPLLERGDY